MGTMDRGKEKCVMIIDETLPTGLANSVVEYIEDVEKEVP